MALVPEQAHQNDTRFEVDLAKTPRLFPNGKRKVVTKQTLYNRVRDFEAKGLNALVRKRHADTGVKRQKVTRGTPFSSRTLRWLRCAAHIYSSTRCRAGKQNP